VQVADFVHGQGFTNLLYPLASVPVPEFFLVGPFSANGLYNVFVLVGVAAYS
jgi:hypothetical protein